jgi:hypothetical protein
VEIQNCCNRIRGDKEISKVFQSLHIKVHNTVDSYTLLVTSHKSIYHEKTLPLAKELVGY